MHGGNIWAAARRTGRPAGEWLDFSASINPLGTPPAVRAAARAALTMVGHYPDPDAADLCVAAAARYGLSPACVRFGNGVAELIHLLAAVLAPPAALVLAPTFSRYAAALQPGRAAITELPAWPEPPDPDALRAWLRLAPARAAVFLCNPNNPTGRLLPPPVLAAALAQERTWVVVDEAFLDFAAGGHSLLSRAGHHPKLVVLRSLTKLYGMPGLRLGWLAGPQELVAAVAHRQVPWSVNAPAAAAGLAALTGPEIAGPTAAAVAAMGRHQQQALSPFRRWLEPCATDANFFLVRLHGLSGTALQEQLLAHGILVRLGAGFTGLGDQYLRLAVRPRREVRRLVAALAEVLIGNGRAT